MKDNDEKMLGRFFDSSVKMEIADDGFSHRVSADLPYRAEIASRLLTTVCVAAGMLLLYLADIPAVLQIFVVGLVDALSAPDIWSRHFLDIYTTMVVVVVATAYVVAESDNCRFYRR